MKTLIFRADGKENIGLGHMYRLFALIEMVKERYQYVFVSRFDSTLSVIPKSVPIQLIPESVEFHREPEWLTANFNPANSVLIADGYQFGSEYQKVIKQAGFKMVYVDDLTTGHFFADVVINHAPHVKDTDFLSEPYTKFCLGTRYALLRPAFLEAAAQTRETSPVSSVFVSFGGADPLDLTFHAVSALEPFEHIEQIHVVLGAAYRHQQVVDLAKDSKKLFLHRKLDERQLVETMQRCQLGIAPASTILYELCCVKLPVLSGYYVDNQKLIYEGTAKSGAIVEGGNFEIYTTCKFHGKLKEIFAIKSYQSMVQAQAELFDSNIRERYLEIIDSLC